MRNLEQQLAEKDKYTYTGEEVGKIEQNYDNQLAITEKALELACKEELRGIGVFDEDYGSEQKLLSLIEDYKQQAKEML